MKSQNELDLITEFRCYLCRFHGYDENLKYVGEAKPGSPTDSKAFLVPRDFLNFAIEDSRTLEDERNRVNCLTNCKRAIDAQVERLIGSLGFFPLAKKQGWNIPKKLDFISNSGVVAPRILRNVNALRNRLEHDYAVPSKQEVEDAFDIATLFVSYAELVEIPSLNWTLPDGLSVRYDYDEMVFHFFKKDPSHSPESDASLSVAYGEEGFQNFYDFLMKIVPSMSRRSL